jgi:hypothetical protein
MQRRLIMKNIIILLAVTFLLSFITGCATTGETKLYDYIPTSEEDKDVYDFFVECDKAIGDQDLEKFLACYNDGAKIRIFKGEGSNPIVTKSAYRTHLMGGAFKRMKSNKLKNPKISVNGDTANIKCNITYENRWTQWHTFSLIKDNGKWSIIRADYKWTS